MTGPLPMRNIAACVFDAYGTLFDIAKIVDAARTALGDKADALSRLWREKQLQYTWLRSLMGVHEDFWHVTGEALDYAMDALKVGDVELRATLMQQYLAPPCFPDAITTLHKLKSAGLRTAILSNGSMSMLAGAVNANSMRSHLDAVLSVDAVKVFKPHPSVYKLAVDRLGVPAERIAFQSSNAWDAYAAAQYGMRVAWINRSGQPAERIPREPDAVIQSLNELPALLTLE
jgi:2-haloacid dehalogenase